MYLNLSDSFCSCSSVFLMIFGGEIAMALERNCWKNCEWNGSEFTVELYFGFMILSMANLLSGFFLGLVF